MKLATLCYVRAGTLTLMLHRNRRATDFHSGRWNGLGGKLAPGETPEDGVMREVFEEAGLSLERTDLSLRGLLTFPLFDGTEDWYVFVFVAQLRNISLQASLKTECEEGSLHWVEHKELLTLNLWPGDRIFLPWLDQALFFSGKFIYKDKELIGHEVIFYE